MADIEGVPPEILDFFRQLRDLVDQTVGQLETAVVNDGVLPQAATVQDQRIQSGTAYLVGSGHVTATGSVITPDRLAAAKAWLATTKGKVVIGGSTAAIGFLANLEGLIALAERVFDLRK